MFSYKRFSHGAAQNSGLPGRDALLVAEGFATFSYRSVRLSKETLPDDDTTDFENVGNHLPNNTVSYLRKVDTQSEHEFSVYSLEQFYIFH